MDVDEILSENKSSILLIEKREHNHIVVGVPHHAPAGKSRLPCPSHLDSDENAGFLGRYLAERLNCCSIIACNYPFDVNKCLCSDYTKQILRWGPQILIEIHGHGGKSNNFDIEISSGSEDKEKHSMDLAERLLVELSKIEALRNLKIGGKFQEIYFKAKETATITDARWLAYHIELPAVLRKPEGAMVGIPSPLGFQFCDALLSVLQELHSKSGEKEK